MKFPAKSVILATILLTACNEEIDSVDVDSQAALEAQEIIDNLIIADYPESEIELRDDNTVLVGGDTVVTLEASREIAGVRQLESMLEDEAAEDFRHYRTNNLVNPRTFTVVGYTGGSNALDATMKSALQMAVANYNALNLDVKFTLSFATSTSADIVVYKVSGAGGGSAGFPSGGNPYKWVQIHDGTSAYGVDVVEHVMTHEIGHTLGFRHTDYFNRSLSCGSGGNEGDGGVGANHIPGTPTGFDANSIMLSCFSAGEDGEFGANDITALNALYGGAGAPSCAGFCGGNAGTCWCDSYCAQYGDCCADKVQVCG